MMGSSSCFRDEPENSGPRRHNLDTASGLTLGPAGVRLRACSRVGYPSVAGLLPRPRPPRPHYADMRSSEVASRLPTNAENCYPSVSSWDNPGDG